MISHHTGQAFQYSRKRTDLNESTSTKQIAPQIVSIISNQQRTNISMPHIVQNFQYSGLDSNDLKFAVKKTKFPSKMINIYDGDYVEIYAGYSLYMNGENQNIPTTWSDDLGYMYLPTDMSTYTGLKVYFTTSDAAGKSLNAYEIVEYLNANIQAQVQVFYETYYDGYVYNGLPTQDYSIYTYYDGIVLSLMRNGYFAYDQNTGKISFVYSKSITDFTLLTEIPLSTGLYKNDAGASIYAVPTGIWDAGDVEIDYNLYSFYILIYAGRDLADHRYYRLSQIFGADLSYFSYSIGELCSAYCEINSLDRVIAPQYYNATALGSTYSSSITIYGSGLMDVTPVKYIYVYSTLVSNMWGYYGAKQPYIYVHQLDAARGQESGESLYHSIEFGNKENVQGIRNGFEICLKDEFGYDPGLMDNYYMEIAFVFFTV